MEIEKIKISELVQDPKNARTHSEKNLKAIKGSLKKFGQQKPIVVSMENVVIAGNGTMQAAKELGWDELYVKRANLSEIDSAAFALADNKTAELAEWDDLMLSKTLDNLLNEGFEVEEIGFELDDLPGIGVPPPEQDAPKSCPHCGGAL